METKNENYLPVPLKYTRFSLMYFRKLNKQGKHEIYTYFPELGSWIVRKKTLKERLSYRNMTYNEWFSRWFVDIDPTEFGTEIWADEFIKIRYPDKLPDTKRYIKIHLLKDPRNYECNFLMTRLDFINTYKESRIKAGIKLLNFDFSKLPEIIESTFQTLYLDLLEINPKTGKQVGQVKISYGHFISELRDPSISPQNKDLNFEKDFWKKIKDLKNDDKYSYDEVNYIDSNTPIKIYCKTCKKFFYQTPRAHIHGSGCPICGNKKERRFDWEKERDNLYKLIYKDRLSLVEVSKIYNVCDHQIGVIIKNLGFPDPLEYYRKEDKKIYQDLINKGYTLTEMAEYFNITIQGMESRLKILGLKCENIEYSNGEKYILRYLKENKISTFESQVRFTDIEGRNRNLVIIDVIVEYNNKKYAIEYNGRQHYERINFYQRTLEDFEKQKKRDNNVRNYFMSSKDYVYIEIPYTYSKYEDIKQLLDYIILGDNLPNTEFNKLYK